MSRTITIELDDHTEAALDRLTMNGRTADKVIRNALLAAAANADALQSTANKPTDTTNPPIDDFTGHA